MYQHGLLVGRFQPPHAGHRMIISHALHECSLLTILIGDTGNSNYGHLDTSSPFSISQRYQMISEILKKFPNTSKRCRIRLILNIHNPLYWPDYLLTYVRHFSFPVPVDRIYCGESRDYDLASPEFKKKLCILKRDEFDTPNISGTIIRKYMLARLQDWEYLVPSEIYKMLNGFVNKIYKEDDHAHNKKST